MGRNDPMRNHLGRIRIVAKLQRHPATFPYMIFLHLWPFCIRHHFTFVFVLSVAVIVRFAIESFCSVLSCLFRDWDRLFYKYHRSFIIFYMFYEYNRLFCRNVFFTLSAAHTFDSFILLLKIFCYGSAKSAIMPGFGESSVATPGVQPHLKPFTSVIDLRSLPSCLDV